MSDFTPPAPESPVRIRRAWPWVAAVAVVGILGGGIAVATTAGEDENSPTRKLCRAIAVGVGADPYMTPAEAKIEAEVVKMYRDQNPDAPLVIRNVMTALAFTYEYWDGSPEAMRLASSSWNRLGELCG